MNKNLLVNYSVKPSLIGLKIENHPDGDKKVRYDIRKFTRIQMLRSDESSITGHDYLKRLKESGQPMLDVRVMEELLKPENQHLIPEDWKKGLTYFFGTIYRDSDGGLCAPYLSWRGDGWRWNYYWLDCDWFGSEFAASLAISQNSYSSANFVPLTLSPVYDFIDQALNHLQPRMLPVACPRDVCESCAEMRGYNNALESVRKLSEELYEESHLAAAKAANPTKSAS